MNNEKESNTKIKLHFPPLEGYDFHSCGYEIAIFLRKSLRPKVMRNMIQEI